MTVSTQPCENLEPRRLFAVLSAGPVTSGSLGNSSATDSYTIGVDSGAPFVVALRQADGNTALRPHLRVTAPNGTTVVDLDDDDRGGVSTGVPTSTSGTYTIRVTSDSGSGAYTLAAFRPTANVGETDLIAADSGRRFGAQVSPGDVDFYTLDANAGDAISVNVAENASDAALEARVALVAPDGRITLRTADQGLRIETRAVDSGRYFVVVSDNGDDDSGFFGVTTTRVPGTQYSGDPDTAPLNPGVTRNGDLPAGDADVFTLPVSGDRQTLVATLGRGSGSTLEPSLVLYNSNGDEVARGFRAGDSSSSTITANVDALHGPYYLLARDEEADDGGTFTYRYTLETAAPPITLAGGVLNITGTGGPDTINVYRVQRDGAWKVGVDYSGFGTTSFFDDDDVDSVRIEAGDGSDSISLYSSLTVSGYVQGGAGDDTLRGGGGGDSLVGGAGRNRLYGGEGTDTLRGSNGRDFLHGEGGDDRLYGNAGNDYLDGGGNKDRLFGGDGDDFLQGGGSNDQLYAEAGNDTLNGGSGTDNFDGGNGIDRVEDRQSGDRLISIESV